MSPERLRAYVLIITRDLLPPCLGAYLTVRWWGTIEPFHLPLLMGLFGVPFFAPRKGRGTSEETEGGTE